MIPLLFIFVLLQLIDQGYFLEYSVVSLSGSQHLFDLLHLMELHLTKILRNLCKNERFQPNFHHQNGPGTQNTPLVVGVSHQDVHRQRIHLLACLNPTDTNLNVLLQSPAEVESKLVEVVQKIDEGHKSCQQCPNLDHLVITT